MDKKVSIVIPTYNRKRTIIKVIDSYLGQAHLYELIFIVDGSTDGTYEYLREQAMFHPVIKIKRHGKTQGVSVSRNDGLDTASGNYILFGEDDVHLGDSYIGTLLNCLEKTNADIAGGRIFYSRRDETVEQTINRCQDGGGPLMNYWLMSANYSRRTSEPQPMPFLHAISLGKADVCKKIRFDPAFFAREETDFYLRAGEKGHKIMFCPDAVCVHLQRDREGGGGWRVGVWKYQALAAQNNNLLVEKHYPILKEWGMKGNKITFKLLHLLNRIRILYIYYKFSLKRHRS